MIIRFQEQFRLPLEEVYGHFQSPAHWARLFGFPGDSREMEEGWFSVPLKNFPFPLEARHVEMEPGKLARWVFRGFWRGRGEVHLRVVEDRVEVTGFEEIAVRPLGFLSPILEKLVLKRGFEAVWAVGWHRLRKAEAARLAAELEERD